MSPPFKNRDATIRGCVSIPDWLQRLPNQGTPFTAKLLTPNSSTLASRPPPPAVPRVYYREKKT